MSKVFAPKYPIPKLGRGATMMESVDLIQRALYGSDYECMDKDAFMGLCKKIQTYGPKVSIEQFCTLHNCFDIIDFVEIMSKFLGVGFNSVSFSTQEDTLIRAYYPIFGRNTNRVVFDIMFHNLKVEDYVLRSEKVIQDRVDYLQQGKNYFGGVFKVIVPSNMKKMIAKNSTALVCVDIPKNRPAYSNAEQRLLSLVKTYGINFLPWKDGNEVEYHITKNTQQKAVYVGLCHKYDFEGANLFSFFLSNCRAGLTILLNKKFMRTFDPAWNSYMDEVLKECVKNMSTTLNLNNSASMKVLYKPLIKMGKTVEECEVRRQALGIAVKYSRDEISVLLHDSHRTFEQQAKGKSGFKRGAFSLGNTVMNIENQMGCRIADMTEEMKEEILARYNQ